MNLQVLHRDELKLGGFAGLREHRLVMDPRVWGPGADPDARPGLGGFVYLADARFMPRGETTMHPHHEIDVISVVVEGRISHRGSLGHGEDLSAFAVQVQRAGGEGFVHNEVNPDNSWNRMIQIWVLPEVPGLPAGYQVFRPEAGTMTRVYGGPPGRTETFSSATLLDIGRLNRGETLATEGECIAYVIGGEGEVDGRMVSDGDLLHGIGLRFEARDDAQLILVHML